MAGESPKKPVQRVPVPNVQKKMPTQTGTNKNYSFVLLLLFLLAGSIVYIAIFQKDKVASFFSSTKAPEKINNTKDSTDIAADTLALNEEISDEEEESNLIGETKPASTGKLENAEIHPSEGGGGTYYLVAATYIFYPYAENTLRQLKAKGYDAGIITQESSERKYYRVYLESSSDGTAIRSKRDQIRAEKGWAVWVYTQ